MNQEFVLLGVRMVLKSFIVNENLSSFHINVTIGIHHYYNLASNAVKVDLTVPSKTRNHALWLKGDKMWFYLSQKEIVDGNGFVLG